MPDELEIEVKYFLTVTVNDEVVYEDTSFSEEDVQESLLRKAEHAIEAKKQELTQEPEPEENYDES